MLLQAGRGVNMWKMHVMLLPQAVLGHSSTTQLCSENEGERGVMQVCSQRFRPQTAHLAGGRAEVRVRLEALHDVKKTRQPFVPANRTVSRRHHVVRLLQLSLG